MSLRDKINKTFEMEIDKEIIECILDLRSGINKSIEVKQADHNSHILKFHLVKDDSVPIRLHRSRVDLYIRKSDNKIVVINGTIENEETGLVSFSLTRQALAVLPSIDCEVVKTGLDGSTLSFPLFSIGVKDSIYDCDEVESSNEFSALVDALNKVENVDVKYEEMFENKINEFEDRFLELKGDDGVTPNIQIGIVTTLEPGEEATVTRSGTDEEPILNFGIPRGEDGQGGGGGVFIGKLEEAPKSAKIVIDDEPSPYDLFYEDSNVDYMGNVHTSLKEKADADIEYLLRKFGTQHYEGTNITATDTYQKQVKSAILKGKTGYRDKDTGEILETFEEGRNLELVSVTMPVLKTQGKNLFNTTLTPGGIDSTTGEYNNSSDRVRTNDFIEVSDVISITRSVANGLLTIFQYNSNKNFISSKAVISGETLTGTTSLDANTRYIHIVDKTNDVNSFIQVEQNSTATSYEPFKSKILSIDGEYRGIGDVCDTVDCMTGEVVERIGEIVLDGSENWVIENPLSNDEYIYFKLNDPNTVKSNVPTTTVVNVLTDKLKISSYAKETSTKSNSYFQAWTSHFIGISRTELSTQDVVSFKKWLSNNNILIQYPLSEKSIKTVDLSNQKIYSYDGTTHYSCSAAEGALIPTLAIDVPTNTPKMIARQRETIEQQEQKLSEQEEVQNILIESQLAWYEQTLISSLDLPNKEQLPTHIQKLYEIAYKRGIRTQKGEL